jgi:hypothetical protein
MECKELIDAIIWLNWENIKEEVGDVCLFFQLWLFWQFSLDGKLWLITHHSCRKFQARQPVWRDLYGVAGLGNTLDASTANYRWRHKVVDRLTTLGVDKDVANAAYDLVVLPRLTIQEKAQYKE